MQRQSDSSQFTSEGFDLDALAGENAENVVYELGGTASVVVADDKTSNHHSKEHNNNNNNDDVVRSATEIADDLKAKGNAAFKEKNWLEAIDMYTAAIQSLPGVSASELLQMRDEYEKEQQLKVRQQLAKEDERKREKSRLKKNNDSATGSKDGAQDSDEEEEEEESESVPPVKPFSAPPHVHAERLAVLHANRAAALIYLEEYQQALQDCDVAILWKPSYTKAYLRRATLYEKHLDNNTEAALADAKTAQRLDPGNRQIQALVKRLQKLEDERLEKLKAETLVRLRMMDELTPLIMTCDDCLSSHLLYLLFC